MLFSLILCSNKPFLDHTGTSNKRWILYNWGWPARRLDGGEAPKHFPKLNSHQKKGHGHWWSAASLTHYSFLNPGKTITSEKYAQQINEMHKKLQHLQPAPVNKKGSILFHNTTQLLHKQHFKSWTNWAMKFCLIHHIHLTSRQPSLLQASWQLFARRLFPQPAGHRKCFPRIHQISKQFISHWQNVLIVINPILINKDVFQASYNDLKFMVWNSCYVHTNLIYVLRDWHSFPKSCASLFCLQCYSRIFQKLQEHFFFWTYLVNPIFGRQHRMLLSIC